MGPCIPKVVHNKRVLVIKLVTRNKRILVKKVCSCQKCPNDLGNVTLAYDDNA